MEEIVQIFKALGDETRLKILIIVSKRRICAKGIAKHLGISEAAVSQHLRVLKEAAVIVGEKSGYYVHYNLQKPLLSEVTEIIKAISEDEALDNCKLGVHIPSDCNVLCKANKNRCCQKK